MSDSESDPDEVEEYESFAQPTLIDQLRKILDEYPDDGQIIKELIQNADDAGAKCMKILYVGKTVNPQTDGEKKYRKFLRGPALVFYNDAKFSQDDWTGIRTIYNSVKADDPLTVGRFGLGFKSVFHITDFPCIVSGDRILFLNPLERKSHKVCVTIPIHKLHKSKTVDQCDILSALDGIFGFSNNTLQDGTFHGTLFWFPLRSAGTKLSENLYEESRVLDLFKAFMSDAETSLLFLKGLLSIQLFCSMSDSPASFTDKNLGVDNEFFSVVLREHYDKEDTKAAFMKQIQDLNGSLPDETLRKSINCDIALTQYHRNGPQSKDLKKWLLLNFYPGEPIEDTLRALIDNKDLCYSPLVSVATCTDQTSRLITHKKGKIFCFQPLPEEMENLTGLPIHINAFFALTQNRRHIKLPSADQEHFQMQLAKPIEWNMALISDILPTAYANLVLGIIESYKDDQLNGPIMDTVYNTLPDFQAVHSKWKAQAKKVFKLLSYKPFLHTKANGGEWITAQEAVFADTDCIQAVVHLLVSSHVKLVLAPNSIQSSIEDSIQPGAISTVTPEFVLDFMKKNEAYKLLAVEQKFDLLHYLYESDCKNKLHGLQLVPVEDGSFTNLGGGDMVYVEDTKTVKLFPGLERYFLSTNVGEKTFNLFKEMAEWGKYQVCELDVTANISLVRELLEKEFMSLQPPLKVDKEHSKTWKPWLQKFWTFMLSRFQEHVESFTTLPLFPVFSKRSWSKVQSFCLYPLSFPLLCRTDKNGTPIPVELCSVFELLSVNVVHSLPAWLDDNVVDSYIHRYTGSGVVALLSRMSIEDIQYFNKEASFEQKSLLLECMSSKLNDDVLNATAKRILRGIEMFKEKESARSKSKHVSAESCNGSFDRQDFPVPFPKPLIQLESNEKTFGKILGINKLKTEEVVLDTLQVIDNYSPDEVVTFMIWLLTHRFHENNKPVANLAKSVKFLSVENTVYKPSDLFDPTDSILVSLFDGFKVFPTDQRFKSPELLLALRRIGLKTRFDVEHTDIYNICKRIHMSGSYKKEYKTALNVLKFLNMNENYNLLMKSEVSNLKWIPVHDDNRAELLQYNKGRGTLVSPLEVMSARDKDIVGAVVPLMDCRKYSQIAKRFQWNKQPAIVDVVTQMSIIVKNYSDSRKADFLSASISCYKWLDSMGNLNGVKEALNEVFAENDYKYIWTGFGFASCETVIVTKQAGDIDLKPFLWFLSSEISHMKTFFQQIGCKRIMEARDYTDILKKIKDLVEADTESDKAELLHLAINILNRIKEEVEHGNIDKHCTIFVPIKTADDTMVMKPAAECTFGNARESLEEGLLCVHEDVPLSTAEAVGVQSFKQQMMSELEGIEEWGQTEPLTRRLHNLLQEGYVDGFSVPKELFQNADDAKASKLWILYDERENEDAMTGLLNDAMSEVQGPALWVYNDATFTEADFKNITKLSGATKQPDASKIGKFGLGFCSVYNLTDVPIFLSAGNVVIFDPHTTYLGKALPGRSPGLRINLKIEKNRRMVRRLHDQFMPFENIFGCTSVDTMSSYNGTLFRLPLRNKKGKISDVIYRGEEIMALLSKIKQYASNMLIFSQHVKELQLFHLKRGAHPEDSNLLFSTKKTKIPPFPKALCCESILSEASRMKNENVLGEDCLQVIENISIEADDRELKFSGTVKWLVSWATGTEIESLELTKKDKGALPLAATAVPYESTNGQYSIREIQDLPNCFYQNSHYFCFLPLPLEHCFRFHINGQFSVSSDRRRLRTAGDEDKRKLYHDWNESLMSDAAVNAFVRMLKNMHTVGETTDNSFYRLWPCTNDGSFTKSFLKSFYKYIIHNDEQIFGKDGCRYSMSKCIFLDPNLRDCPYGDISFEIFDAYSTSAVAIDIPGKYYKLLREADRGIIEERTVKEVDFFLNYFLPNLLSISTSNQDKSKRDTLLRHAIDLDDSDIHTWLSRNRCLPTKPNDDLKIPSDVVDENSPVGKLFSESDGRFVLDELSSKVNSCKLRDLGVMYEDLPDHILVERAMKINTLNQKCEFCSLTLCKLLLQYIVEHESSHEEAWPKLRSVNFLPVANKPDGWPSEWEAEILADVKVKKAKLCKEHKGEKTTVRHVYERAPALYCSDLGDYVGCSFLVFDGKSCQGTESFYKQESIFRKRMDMKGMQDVSFEIVLQQIKTFADSCDTKIKQFDKERIGTIMKKIYKYLDGHKDISTFEFPAHELVWTSKTFTKPALVAVSNSGRDCSPFLFDLDDSPLRQFKKLYEALGIKDTFTPQDILLVLSDMFSQLYETPVESENREAVLSLLESLRGALTIHGKTFIDLLDDECIIYVPDTEWILRDSRKLCFNDDSQIEVFDTMLLANEGLTIATAKALGIKSKVNQFIQDTSDSVEFYQDEPLVTRLNNILSGYPCDSGIFKELIQNADDAGATEIHFLLDSTCYGTNVFDESFEALQGPALCVFNNKAFTQKDLKGIQNLGRGSKGEDPSKTGQYGVGFNSVYNLTDAPSFLTKGSEIENGETLCIFDPMARFLPRTFVSKEKPGRRFKDVKTIRTKYSDVLPAYNESFFSVENHGTIFRFPLRLPKREYKSEIKDDTVSVYVLEKMLTDFKLEAAETLIFLKNLGTIKISMKTEYSVSLEMDISVEISTEDLDRRKSYFEKHAEMCQQFKRDKATVFSLPSLTVSYQFALLEKSCSKSSLRSNTNKTEYLVVQAAGYKDIMPPSVVQDHCKSGDLGLLPQGGVASRLSIGGKINKSNPYKVFCFLPLPGETGLPVHVNGHFALDHEGRRGLWKSDNFEQTADYKTLWNKTLITGVIGPAYLNLLGIMKTRECAKLDKEMVLFQIISDVISAFNSYFPIKGEVLDDYWSLLLKFVYKGIVEQERTFLPSLSWIREEKQAGSTIRKAHVTWTAFKRDGGEFPAYYNELATSFDAKDSREEERKSQGCQLTNVFLDCGMNIVIVPENMRESFNFAGFSIESLSPKIAIKFLCSHTQDKKDTCSIKLDTHVENTVVKSVKRMQSILWYCMKDKKYFLERLREMPVFITADYIIRLISPDKPIFVSRYHDFFQNTHHKFICPELVEIFLQKGKFFFGSLDLKPFLMEDFKDLLCGSPFHFLKRADTLQWDKNNPSLEWVTKMWQFFVDEILSRDSDETKDVQSNIRHFLQLFDGIAILPACRKSEESSSVEWYLVPPSKLDTTLDISNFQTGNLKSTLQKLNILTIGQEKSDEKTERIFQEIKNRGPGAKCPEKVAICLYLNVHQFKQTSLSTSDAKAILNYLAETCKEVSKLAEKIKALPIFPTYQNELVALSDYQKKISLQPDQLQEDGLDNLAKERGTVLLKSWKAVATLYQSLGVVAKSLEEVYIEIILPHQEEMKREDFYKHVEFLGKKVLSQGYEKELSGKKKKIVHMLTSCKFIEVKKNKYVCVSELFNPRVKVFEIFCKKEELLLEYFNKDYLIKFFEQLGLKSQVTIQVFERFAREIAEKGKQSPIPQAVRNKSGRLLKHVNELKQEIVEKSKFHNLARVPFILPAKMPEHLIRICKPYVEEDKMVSFAESVFYDKLDIAWTSCPVLPEALKILDISIKEKLEAKPSIFMNLFISHCRNVGASVFEMLKKPIEKDLGQKIEEVMESIYEHLLKLKTNSQVDDEKLKELSDIPLIYFKKEPLMHKANCVVIRCSQGEEIRPYLNQMPINLGKYSEMFQAIGATEKPTAESYIRVLQCLKDKCMLDEMLEPDLRIAKFAIHNLLTHEMRSVEEMSSGDQVMYLPSINRKMEDARSIVLCDNNYFRKRIGSQCNVNYFIGISKLEIPNVSEQHCLKFFKNLPIKLRPTLLSDIVEEAVDPATLIETYSSQVRTIECFIRSVSFSQGLMRLVKHTYKEDGKMWDDGIESTLPQILSRIRLVSVSGMKTVLILKSYENGEFKNPKKVSNTEDAKAIHIEDKGDSTKIYVETNVRDWQDDLGKEIVGHLNSALGNCLKEKFFVILLDFFKHVHHPTGLSDMLDKKKIVSHSFTSFEKSSLFSKPGEIVPVKLHQFLDNGYEVIYEYEYNCVAYEIDDPFVDGEANTNESATYVFARIMRKLDSTDSSSSLFDLYEIDIGENETKQVPAYRLYKFVTKSPTTTTETVLYERQPDDSSPNEHAEGASVPPDGHSGGQSFPTGTSEEEQEELDIHKVCKEIKDTLTEAWTKDETTRKCIVKRLLLKWHPDKNYGRETLSTKIFQYIQQCLNKLEKGEPLDDYSDETGGSGNNKSGASGSSGYHRGQRGWRYDEHDSWGGFFRDFDDHFFTGRNRRGRRSSFFHEFRQSEREPYPWPHAARKWQKQANKDFEFAKSCLDSSSCPSYNWICYILHQSAEKSLRAAWYAKDANKLPSESTTDLVSIANGLNAPLQENAMLITRITHDRRQMTYPRTLWDSIPATLYTREDASRVYSYTRKILDVVVESYNIIT